MDNRAKDRSRDNTGAKRVHLRCYEFYHRRSNLSVASFFFAGVKHATSLFNSFCSNVAKKSYTFFVARFTVPIDLLQLPLPLPSPFSITQFHFIIIILK